MFVVITRAEISCWMDLGVGHDFMIFIGCGSFGAQEEAYTAQTQRRSTRRMKLTPGDAAGRSVNPVRAEHAFPPTRGSLDAAAKSLLVYTLPAFV